MSLSAALEVLRTDPRLAPNLVDWHIEAPVPAEYGEWPQGVGLGLRQALARRGVERPYSHQAAAIASALAGQDQVVVTPTASGKSLCYTVPILQAITQDPSSRALLLFPTKALAQDQLHSIHRLVTDAAIDAKTFTYDGDTSPTARRAVRQAGHLVITNPDMLHTGILPNHTRWVRLFENLRYVVIDELHTYRGLFGSHVAQVLRRLLRLCRFYGSNPVFLCSSATIANPGELASALCGRPVSVIDANGAPRGERITMVYNPPIVNRELGLRASAVKATRDVAMELQAARLQTIVFARSRTRVELLTQYLRETESPHPAATPRVRGYRSGYLPKERRAIEAALRSGELRTVVTTNALELGIDIGGLDAAVICGYSGTLASLRQQFGRAGRGEDPALRILVAANGPLDQYIAQHPEFLHDGSAEAGRIKPDNRVVAAEHLKCAVFELPLDADEWDTLGPETAALLEILADDGIVYRQQDRVYWSSDAFPAEAVSLRLAPDQNVVIIDPGPPAAVIGEVDRQSAMTLVHEQAIYVHDGRQYHVDELDWTELKAYVRPVDVDYYTDAHLAVGLKVIEEWDQTRSPVRRGHGEVAVTYLATIFKKIKLHTHENVGWGQIDLPQDDLQTSAFWTTVGEVVPPRSAAQIESTCVGLGRVLHTVAPLILMCDPADLALDVQVRSPHTRQPTIFLWERVPGGVGAAEHLYTVYDELIARARQLVEDCPCRDGCPACVGPPEAGLSTKRWVLEELCAQTQDLRAGRAPAEVLTGSGA